MKAMELQKHLKLRLLNPLSQVCPHQVECNNIAVGVQTILWQGLEEIPTTSY